MTPKASPTSAGAENARLACTSRSTPSNAVPRPRANVALGRRPQKIQTTIVTNGAARLARRVEFATEVKRMDQCQKPRSPANASPAAPSSFQSIDSGVVRRVASTSSHSSGAASATRQNALAVGPTSARRTKIGESAMKVAPANRAGREGGIAARNPTGPLLEVVPALERSVVALLCQLDVALQRRLTINVSRVQPAAAAVGCGTVARYRGALAHDPGVAGEPYCG